MSAPRHLWSGDWRFDSASAAEELAKRRTRIEDTEVTEPELAPPAGPSVTARLLAWLREVRQSADELFTRGWASWAHPIRVGTGVALAALLSAGIAYAAVSLVIGSGSQSPATAKSAPPWLGVDVGGSFPLLGGNLLSGSGLGVGVIVANVAPGSPAAAAGLEPGDVITQIGNHAVATPAEVTSAIAGLHAGDQVQIQYQRGLTAYTTAATLVARPAGSP